jgi:hypothetical protein
MSITGTRKEVTGEENFIFSNYVGIFEAEIIAINPTIEEYKTKLGIELKEDSKAVEYLGESKEGKEYLRIDIWIQDINTSKNFKISFYLKNEEKSNKDKTKAQYINSIGNCSWAESESDLPEWFTKRDYRIANIGEEELYNFMKTWLGNLDYRNDETTIELDWKKLMKGNVKELKEQIKGEWATTIVALATVTTSEKEGEIKSYQNVYNRSFAPGYSFKKLKGLNYNDKNIQKVLLSKLIKDLKVHEKFVVNVIGEYGCKDFYTLDLLKEYDPRENLAASSNTLEEEDDSDY